MNPVIPLLMESERARDEGVLDGAREAGPLFEPAAELTTEGAVRIALDSREVMGAGVKLAFQLSAHTKTDQLRCKLTSSALSSFTSCLRLSRDARLVFDNSSRNVSLRISTELGRQAVEVA
jgi:hypothetical protein